MPNQNENKATSENYIDLIIKNSDVSESFLQKNKDIAYNQTLLSDYGILSIHKDNIEGFNQAEGTLIIQEMPKLLGLMGRQSLEASGIIAVQTQPYLSLKGNGTLVGIIDTGINYTNQAFIYEDNTSKIEYIWDQTMESEKTPQGFSYGIEYTNKEINDAINFENPFEVVPHTDDVGHGTFLASVACGKEELNTNHMGAAPNANLIVVKLKEAKKYLKEYNAIGDNVKNVYQSSDVMAALEYIRTKANALNKPVAVCISLGTNAGAHDGLSLFEEYISRVAIKNAMVIAAAMGNEGTRRSHVLGKLSQTGEKKDIEIRVEQNTPGFAVGIYAYASDKISVSITSPTGEFRRWSFLGLWC